MKKAICIYDGSFIANNFKKTNDIRKISNSYVGDYLNQKNMDSAKKFWKSFFFVKGERAYGPLKGKTNYVWSEENHNYLGTWLDYAFFFEIWSSKNEKNNIGLEKGAILIDSNTTLKDND